MQYVLLSQSRDVIAEADFDGILTASHWAVAQASAYGLAKWVLELPDGVQVALPSGSDEDDGFVLSAAGLAIWRAQ